MGDRHHTCYRWQYVHVPGMLGHSTTNEVSQSRLDLFSLSSGGGKFEIKVSERVASCADWEKPPVQCHSPASDGYCKSLVILGRPQLVGAPGWTRKPFSLLLCSVLSFCRETSWSRDNLHLPPLSGRLESHLQRSHFQSRPHLRYKVSGL